MTWRPAGYPVAVSDPSHPAASLPPGGAARPSGWLLGYPTDHLMAILPSVVAADAAVSELAREGVTAGAVRILVGEDAALRIDGRGKHHGLVARIYRLVQFTQMDQAPDFRRYEIEARRGHPVIAVRETDAARRRAILAVLRSHGAHFINFYGRFFTETLDPFTGPDEGDLRI